MPEPSSDAQDRLIEKPSEEMTEMIAEPFASAEISYRQHHLAEQYTKGRRIRVPRRPSLRLPSPRRRPLSVA
jgi:hypothetical protein